MERRFAGLVIAILAACGGGAKPTGAARPAEMGKMDSKMMEGGEGAADEASRYGPLDIGADWKTYTKLNKTPVTSETHGGRLVDTYVNAVGLDAYKNGTRLPEGSIVVKTSRQTDGTDGPIFVMQKRAAGFNPEHGDWYFAIHWADPPGKWKQLVGGPLYWRTPSKKAEYCSDCHDGYEERDFLGGVPPAQRAY